jgi:hypothetical protein
MIGKNCQRQRFIRPRSAVFSVRFLGKICRVFCRIADVPLQSLSECGERSAVSNAIAATGAGSAPDQPRPG